MSTGLLSSFLNAKPEASPAGSMQVEMLPISYIMPNPDNQKIYIVGDVERLKDDIKANGVRQPLEVIQWANGYKLIGGERRLTACKQLAAEGDERFSTVPCIIVESKGELEDKISLITANATARDLTDWERVAQYEALKEALTKKKQAGQLEGKVRDELCKILGISTGAAARLNIVATTENETIKERLRAGEIGFMQAVKDAQDYARFMGQESEEPEPEEPQKAAPPETIPKPASKPPLDIHDEIVQSIERTAPSVYRAAPQAAKPEEKSEPAAKLAEFPEKGQDLNKMSSRGINTLIKLAVKTVDEASWALYMCEVKFKLEYYTQPLPGGAVLWMRLDETAKERKRQNFADYAIILQDNKFYTDGWENRQCIVDDLAKWFNLN